MGSFIHNDVRKLNPTGTDHLEKDKYHTYASEDHITTSGVLRRHVAAVWDSLQVLIVPGPGLFGRAVTFHMCWGHDGELAPTSVSEMVLFHGYRTHTFGGAANFSEADRTFVAPFNEGRSDVLKARNFIVGGKIRFYIHWTEANFGTTQVDGDRLLMHITGTYKVYGLN